MRPTWCQAGRHCAAVSHKQPPPFSSSYRAHFSLALHVISGQLPLQSEPQTEGTGKRAWGTTPSSESFCPEAIHVSFASVLLMNASHIPHLRLTGGRWSSHKERGLLAERSTAITVNPGLRQVRKLTTFKQVVSRTAKQRGSQKTGRQCRDGSPGDAKAHVLVFTFLP